MIVTCVALLSKQIISSCSESGLGNIIFGRLRILSNVVSQEFLPIRKQYINNNIQWRKQINTQRKCSSIDIIKERERRKVGLFNRTESISYRYSIQLPFCFGIGFQFKGTSWSDDSQGLLLPFPQIKFGEQYHTIRFQILRGLLYIFKMNRDGDDENIISEDDGRR